MKKLLLPTALLLGPALFGLGAASAAPKISAQSIIVNPVRSNLGVRVWTDRDPGGNGTPGYQVGDHIRIYTSVSQDAYVYLFNVNPDGSIDQILPNRYASGANFVKANTTKVFPGSGDGFTFDIAGPYGVNKVLALASETPLNLDRISQFRSGQPFADVNVRGQNNLAQALSIVVNPVAQDSWVTDTAYYSVARPSTVTPVPPVTVAPQPVRPNPIINITINIQPYDSVSAQSVNLDQGYNAQFEAGSGLGDVYGYYENQLLRQGYTLQDRRQRGNHMDGSYSRNGQDATLSVKQMGRRFEVQLQPGR